MNVFTFTWWLVYVSLHAVFSDGFSSSIDGFVCDWQDGLANKRGEHVCITDTYYVTK